MEREKRDILSFAKSIIDNSSSNFGINNKFLDLLIETSLAAAFYSKHKDKIPTKYIAIFQKIYDGVQVQNEYHNKTIETLKKSNLEYYLLKDQVEPYANRYTSDVDVFVDKEDILKMHNYLQNEEFLLYGDEFICHFNIEFVKVASNQSNLLELQELKIQLYNDFYRKKKDSKNDAIINSNINIINELRTEEERYFDNEKTFPCFTYFYKRFDKKRTYYNKKKLLKLNSRIHLLFTINKLLFARTKDAYIKYDNFFFKLLQKFESYIPPKKSKGIDTKLNKINLNYHRGIEFIDIKTRIPALNLAEKKDILTYGNKLAPVDNLILNASHFRGNIKRSKKDYSYQGFLKYLLDGAILIKRNNIDCELLKERAKKFKVTSQLKYYLYLLNKTGLINYKCKLPFSFGYIIFKHIPPSRLLFNENSIYILFVKRLIKMKNLKYRIFNKLD